MSSSWRLAPRESAQSKHMTPVVETVAPVESVKPVEETPTEADSTVAAVEADVWKVDLCGGCCKSAGCAGWM